MKGRVTAGFVAVLLVFALLTHAGATSVAPARVHTSSPSDAHPKRSSSAIALTSDGTVLLVVNPDSNCLSLVTLGTLATVTELPVGVDPRTVALDDTGTRAYVANQGSDTISIVDLDARTVKRGADLLSVKSTHWSGKLDSFPRRRYHTCTIRITREG